MKIEKLIEIFEQCIPTYQKCVDENWDFIKIEDEFLSTGICNFCNLKSYCYVYYTINNYYKYYLNFNNSLLCITALQLYCNDKQNLIIKQAIQPRLKFLKQQVKELKKLQKQGYTHV